MCVCVCVSVCVCVRACVHACVRACVRARAKFARRRFMKKMPESEIQATSFRRYGRKTQRNFGEKILRFSPFNFQEKWPEEISREILHIFHEGRNKILSPRDSGSRGREARRRRFTAQFRDYAIHHYGLTGTLDIHSFWPWNLLANWPLPSQNASNLQFRPGIPRKGDSRGYDQPRASGRHFMHPWPHPYHLEKLIWAARLQNETAPQPSGPEETSSCRGTKIAARQFLPLNCLSITLIGGGNFEKGKMPALVGERQFGRHFRRQFGRG